MASPQQIAAKLSYGQRVLLLRHIDRSVPINLRELAKTTQALFYLKLITAIGVGRCTDRPTCSRLTRLGREVCCIVLAGYAEALVAAGCLQGECMLDINTILKREPEIA